MAESPLRAPVRLAFLAHHPNRQICVGFQPLAQHDPDEVVPDGDPSNFVKVQQFVQMPAVSCLPRSSAWLSQARGYGSARGGR